MGEVVRPLAQLDINLSLSNLTKIPMEQMNSNLRSIDLKQNKITLLPPELFSLLPHLWKLQLDHNLLTSLPDFLPLASSLRTLTLSHNSLESPLPLSLFECTQLERLDLS